MTQHGFVGFQSELGRLVEQFKKNIIDLKSSAYDEASLRQEFLNPLFRALGWDVENKAGAIPSKREVEIESRTQIGGGQKRADYLFRTDGIDRFVCEAKKPAEVLQARYAFQAKRYAWNKDLPLAVLTDFEEIKVYVVGGKPHHDEPDIGLWKTWHFQQYPLVAQELWDLLARERVGSGSIDKLVESLPKRPAGKGKARQAWLFKPDRSRSLDNDFLEFLDEARRALASDLFRENDRETLEGTKLNEAVQRILDRILFLRICEDRDIDTGPRLNSIVDIWRKGEPREAGLLWRAIVRHFRELDRRPPSQVPFFNGNLFKPHFSEDLRVGDDWLIDFVGDLSDEESPYVFSVIPVEILGSIYERFLGKIVRPHGKGITVEDKPEVRKAGGVYYTPRYIVNYLVEQTLGKQLDAITATDLKDFQKQTNALRALDMACGSGSFLIRVFDRVCEHWQAWLTRQRPPSSDKVAQQAFDKKHRRLCWVNAETGDIHLTVALKRQILIGNIYGVDLDAGAVEVTQLSLYLKMLENENRTTLDRERELFPNAVALLPPLDDNIKWGNSLIASDFSLVPDDLIRVHAFDWSVQFPSIMNGGGFHAIVGNPPWGADLEPESRKYLSSKFARVVERMVDSYIYFTDQALRVSKKEGCVGFVVPSTVLNQVDARPLRQLLISTGLAAVINLGKDVFTTKVLNTTTLIVTAGGSQPREVLVGDLSTLPLAERAAELGEIQPIESTSWIGQVRSDPTNTFFANSDARTALLQKLQARHRSLGEFTVAGIARGVSPDIAEAHVLPDRAPALKRIEKSVLRRSISGPRIKRYGDAVSDQWLIYTHKGIASQSIPQALSHLKAFRHQNTCKEVVQGKHPWWALHRARDPEIFRSPKLIGLTTTKTIEIVFDEHKDLVVTDAMYVFRFKAAINVKAALAVLHSRLFLFLYRVSNQGESRVIPQIKAAKLEPLPFPDLSRATKSAVCDQLVRLADKMLSLVPRLRQARSDSERKTLQNALTATDQQIDTLVYELYGLTPEEIVIVDSDASR